MKEIPVIGSSDPALCDDIDYPVLSYFEWYVKFTHNRVYAKTHLSGNTIYMHHMVFRPQKLVMVNHADSNGLNNQRQNLRVATRTQVTLSNGKFRGKYTSGHKGVAFMKRTGRWRAQLKIAGQNVFQAEFDHEDDAAHAFDAAALKHGGEFAYLNFPPLENGAKIEVQPKPLLPGCIPCR